MVAGVRATRCTDLGVLRGVWCVGWEGVTKMGLADEKGGGVQGRQSESRSARLRGQGRLVVGAGRGG